MPEVDDQEARGAANEATLEHGPAGAAKLKLERRLPLFDRYRAELPEFVQRRHATALDAATAKAQRGIDALQDLYGR